MTVPEEPQDDLSTLEGAISVLAALESGSRQVASITVRLGSEEGLVRRLLRIAEARGVPIARAAAEEIDRQAGGKTHGGVLAHVGPRRFADLEALLTPGVTPFIVMIDGVEDPFNFGAAVRSLYAAGATGLVLRPRNWMSAAAVVARASAGASERLATAVAETAEDAALFFKERGLLVACATDAPPTTELYAADLTRPLFLLIGGEKRGVTRSFQDKADLRLRIPYGRTDAYSLGTAAAAAVLSFEILRQRQFVHSAPSSDPTPPRAPAAPSPTTRLPRRPSRGS